MANSQRFQHPGSGIPGALPRACSVVHPAAQTIRMRPSVASLIPAANLDSTWNLQSDSTDKRLPTWQATPKAFAHPTHGEEP